MSDVKSQGKPAFPTNARMHSNAQGLSKREYFAAMAMQGLLSNSALYRAIAQTDKASDEAIDLYTKAAIEHADELLKQLEQ